LSTKSDIRRMEDIRVRFGQRLRELRLEKGWSQETLANLSEIDRTYIPGIENGKRNVSILILERLASVFQISISELLKDL
jgi:transcriptional regulator with XRE-family HTH domain